MDSASQSPRLITIDCEYTRPRFAAAYLLIVGSGSTAEALFVDNNTAHSVPLLMAALTREGLKPEQVKYAIITHVHLDHAGGTSALMRACSKARLLAHPKSVRHMVDPSRLVGSARQVYGAEEFERLYGEITPVDAARAQAVEDGEVIRFGPAGGVELKFLHTRGHANHHACIEFSGQGIDHGIFTGDAFGLAYPALQSRGLFVFPSTSPTDFDAEEARRSVRRIVDTSAKFAYPTHFGQVADLRAAGGQLTEWLDFSEALLEEAVKREAGDAEVTEFCEARIRARMEAEFAKRGLGFGREEQEFLKMDIELNAQGLACVAVKRRSELKDHEGLK